MMHCQAPKSRCRLHLALHVTSSIPATRPPEASTLIAQKTLLNGWARQGLIRLDVDCIRLHRLPLAHDARIPTSRRSAT
ncbi:unnamed protein product [Tilletia controversa]|nr:unnamed protein product [Tilletia controversa]CAD6957024.1 unnamed protein product [Tilletia controversa]